MQYSHGICAATARPISSFVFPSKAPLGFITALNSSHAGFRPCSGYICFINTGGGSLRLVALIGPVAKANNSAKLALASKLLMTDLLTFDYPQKCDPRRARQI